MQPPQSPRPQGPKGLLRALFLGFERLIQRLGWVYAVGWATALGLLFLFADLAEDVLQGEFTALNHAILNGIHSHATPWLDQLALSLSALGGILGTLLIGGAAVALLTLLRRPIDAATLIIVLAGGGTLTFVLKHVFHQPRPSLFASLAPETSYSFPSGHSLMSVCLYGYLSMLLLHWKPRTTWPAALALLLLPLGIMGSRLYLGVHWFTDVAAGALVASFWLTVCMMLRHAALRWSRKESSTD
ncbi:phosphatidylglycerophosphatase B [compost metagenome]